MTKKEIELAKKNGVADKLYPVRVNELIREKYKLSAELAIHRQRDSKPEEFAAYDEYCEACKAQAKEELGL